MSKQRRSKEKPASPPTPPPRPAPTRWQKIWLTLAIGAMTVWFVVLVILAIL